MSRRAFVGGIIGASALASLQEIDAKRKNKNRRKDRVSDAPLTIPGNDLILPELGIEAVKKRWQGSSVPIRMAGTAMWQDDFTFAANWWNARTQNGPDFYTVGGVQICAWQQGSIVVCNESPGCPPGQSCTSYNVCGQNNNVCQAVIWMNPNNHICSPAQCPYTTWLAAHELGHALGLNHSNTGVMSYNVDDWSLSGGTQQEMRDMGYLN